MLENKGNKNLMGWIFDESRKLFNFVVVLVFRLLEIRSLDCIYEKENLKSNDLISHVF